MQRTLILIAIVIVLLGGGAVAYFYFFAEKAAIIVAPSGSTSLPSAEEAPQALDTGVMTDATVSPSIPTPTPVRLIKISAGPVVAGEVVVNKKAENASSSPDVA